MSWLKQSIKDFLHRRGYELGRVADSDAGKLAACFKAFSVDLVYDIGAGTGQYGLRLRRAGYGGRLVSVEPLPEAYAALSRTAATDAAWQVAPRAAIGASAGSAVINIAGNSDSSSLRAMLPAHLRSAPASVYTGTAETPLLTFDELHQQYAKGAARPFLKADTQGYEREVLEGAVASLPQLAGLQLELSMLPLYEGQATWSYFLDRLPAEGFELWMILPGFRDQQTGRMLQMDAVFMRRDLVPT